MANGQSKGDPWSVPVRALLNQAGSLFIAYDVDEPHMVRAVSDSVRSIGGYEADELIGTPIGQLVAAVDWQPGESAGAAISGDVRFIRVDGSHVWLRTSSTPSRVGDHVRFVALGIVVDGLKRREAALRDRQSVDSLTGLMSRDTFVEHVDAQLDEGSSAVVGIVDLNSFKKIVGTLGHPAGDEVLRILGNRLGKLMDERVTIARLGGDEFALLLTGKWSDEQAHSLAERVGATISEPLEVDGIEVHASGSVGLARAAFGSSSTEVMRHADVAMYEAKRGNEDIVMYHDDAEVPQTRRDLAVIAHLRKTLEEELELHYQPIIDLWTGETVAVEGLARWNHPERGVLRPAEFLHAIEIGGLSERLDLWAIDAASKIGSMRTHSGEALRISLNVTAHGLKSMRIVPRLRRLFEQRVLAPEQLILEISERNVHDDLGSARPVLDELRDMGVALSLDDFGTGFSSLTRLRDLPLTEVKMDRSFVSRMNESDADREIVKATVDLGRALGLGVVAEGIETQAIADGASALGCTLAQGRFYAEPMPLADLLNKGLIVRPSIAA